MWRYIFHAILRVQFIDLEYGLHILVYIKSSAPPRILDENKLCKNIEAEIL